jgi:hypothetical protein
MDDYGYVLSGRNSTKKNPETESSIMDHLNMALWVGQLIIPELKPVYALSNFLADRNPENLKSVMQEWKNPHDTWREIRTAIGMDNTAQAQMPIRN